MDIPDGGPEWWRWIMWALFGTPLLFNRYAAKLPWIFGYFGRKIEARADRIAEQRAEAKAQLEAGEPSASVKQLQSEIAVLQDGYARLERSHNELEDSVGRLREELLLANRQLFAVVSWAHQLRVTIVRIDPSHPVPEPPELIRNLV